jgi:hypothetical protein
MEFVDRPDLGHHQSKGCSTIDAMLHCIPNVLGDVEEVFLAMSATGAHIAGGGVCGLTKPL